LGLVTPFCHRQLAGMKTEALARETKDDARKVVFHRVAENLYRLEPTGSYYALLKRGDKQFRRSLKTKDRKLADRRLAEYREQVGGLVISDDARLSFEAIGQRWMDSTAHTLKASTIVRRKICLKNLAPFFTGVAIRNVQAQHCERWVQGRASQTAPQTMAHELNALRAVFDYAVDHGLMLANPAKKIKRRKVIHSPMTIPTREQFRQLVDAIRESDGRELSQHMAAMGADLVELLAYSGCRLNEGISLTWADVDFQKKSVTVTGGERGTKNHEHRTIPMTEALRRLLERLHDTRQPKAADRISVNHSATKSLLTACRRLGYPHFTHHDFRHFFATTCIESGVDIPTVSRWLGHKDGGALAMRVYGHLRQEHSFAAIKKVTL
jgi:integrase